MIIYKGLAGPFEVSHLFNDFKINFSNDPAKKSAQLGTCKWWNQTLSFQSEFKS